MTTTTQTLECPRCHGTGIEERDVRVRGGFSLQLTRCSKCEGRRRLPFHRTTQRPRPYPSTSHGIARVPVVSRAYRAVQLG